MGPYFAYFCLNTKFNFRNFEILKGVIVVERDFKITLKAARVNAKLSQAQAAEKLGVSEVTIRNWEKGVTFPMACHE